MESAAQLHPDPGACATSSTACPTRRAPTSPTCWAIPPVPAISHDGRWTRDRKTDFMTATIPTSSPGSDSRGTRGAMARWPFGARFGIFHDRVFGNLFGNARGNPPFEQDYNQFIRSTRSNGFYGGALNGHLSAAHARQTRMPSATIPDGAQLAPILFDPHFRNPASNNWNFGIQRELAGNNSWTLAYVGSKVTHIYPEVDPQLARSHLVNNWSRFAVIRPTPSVAPRTTSVISPTCISGRRSSALSLSMPSRTMRWFSPFSSARSVTPSTTPCS